MFHVAWLPIHLTTEAHCDTGPAHGHAQAHAAHHHAHADAHEHSHDPAPNDGDHHHFTGDHEANFFAKRNVLLTSPALSVATQFVLVAPAAPVRGLAVEPLAAPPPADFSPPTGPRAPPLA